MAQDSRKERGCQFGAGGGAEVPPALAEAFIRRSHESSAHLDRFWDLCEPMQIGGVDRRIDLGGLMRGRDTRVISRSWSRRGDKGRQC